MRMAPGQRSQNERPGEIDPSSIAKRYAKERKKRLLDAGDAQFVDVSLSDKFRHFQEDSWVGPSAITDAGTMFPDNRCKLLILGTGLGGLV